MENNRTNHAVDGTVGNAFRLKMREGAQTLVRASVSERSGKNYDGNFRKWRNYLEEANALYDVETGGCNEFMDYTKCKQDKIDLLNEFIFHTRTYSANKGTTIAGTLSGIKHIFAANGKDTEVFDSHILSMSKVGCRMLDGVEGRNRQDEEDKRVPFTFDMIVVALDYYENQPSVMLHSVSTCFVLGYFGCLRVSNYIPMPGSEHHAITAGEMSFEFQGNIKRTAYQLATETGNPLIHNLILVRIFVASSKGDRFKKGRNLDIPASGLAPGMFNAAHHLMKWAAMAGYSAPSDLFVSFNGFMPGTSRQEPTYNIMMDEVKRWAKMYGIPVHKAGTHCFRIGSATQMEAGEMEKQEIRDHGDWRTESSCKVYKKGSLAQAQRVYNILANKNIYTESDRQRECGGTSGGNTGMAARNQQLLTQQLDPQRGGSTNASPPQENGGRKRCRSMLAGPRAPSVTRATAISSVPSSNYTRK
jgi:hypothetical protein